MREDQCNTYFITNFDTAIILRTENIPIDLEQCYICNTKYSLWMKNQQRTPSIETVQKLGICQLRTALRCNHINHEGQWSPIQSDTKCTTSFVQSKLKVIMVIIMNVNSLMSKDEILKCTPEIWLQNALSMQHFYRLLHLHHYLFRSEITINEIMRWKLLLKYADQSSEMIWVIHQQNQI